MADHGSLSCLLGLDLNAGPQTRTSLPGRPGLPVLLSPPAESLELAADADKLQDKVVQRRSADRGRCCRKPGFFKFDDNHDASCPQFATAIFFTMTVDVPALINASEHPTVSTGIRWHARLVTRRNS